MTPAVFTVTDVAITAGEGLFKAQGKILKFDGHRRVWPPGGKTEDELAAGRLGRARRSTSTRWTRPSTSPSRRRDSARPR